MVGMRSLLALEILYLALVALPSLASRAKTKQNSERVVYQKLPLYSRSKASRSVPSARIAGGRDRRGVAGAVHAEGCIH
eukprot:2433751-Pleurochrysis_carterae.AAC.1